MGVDVNGRDEFERFVADHGDRLLHAAYGLCGDWQDAEDLVQHALVAVATRWGRITANPAGYAYRCLVRGNVDRWRRRVRRPEVLVEPGGFEAGSAPERDPAGDVAGSLAILAALRILPHRQRAIVVLRYLQDLSEADTAAALGIGVGAVKSGASRGLARLRAADPTVFEELR